MEYKYKAMFYYIGLFAVILSFEKYHILTVAIVYLHIMRLCYITLAAKQMCPLCSAWSWTFKQPHVLISCLLVE